MFFLLFFFLKSYFAVPRNIRLDSTHYFIMKIQNKPDLSKLHIINYQILNLEVLWIFTKNVL